MPAQNNCDRTMHARLSLVVDFGEGFRVYLTTHTIPTRTMLAHRKLCRKHLWVVYSPVFFTNSVSTLCSIHSPARHHDRAGQPHPKPPKQAIIQLAPSRRILVHSKSEGVGNLRKCVFFKILLYLIGNLAGNNFPHDDSKRENVGRQPDA